MSQQILAAMPEEAEHAFRKLTQEQQSAVRLAAKKRCASDTEAALPKYITAIMAELIETPALMTELINQYWENKDKANPSLPPHKVILELAQLSPEAYAQWEALREHGHSHNWQAITLEARQRLLKEIGGTLAEKLISVLAEVTEEPEKLDDLRDQYLQAHAVGGRARWSYNVSRAK